MSAAYLVTGTDTNVGKTYVTATLLTVARSKGLRAVGYKPVAAGAVELDGRRANEDAERLLEASSPGFSLGDINPICLLDPIAPHIAAQDEGVEIRVDAIERGLENLRSRADLVLVEGVGGFRVPLGEFDSADLAQALGLPVILVVGLRLGCINHALLTAEAILARHLPFAGWVANALPPSMARADESIQTLDALLPGPCLGVLPAWGNDPSRRSSAAVRLPG